MTRKDSTQQDSFYQQLGANIRKWRIERGLSQDALANLVGLTRTSLTNIEKGRQHPPLHTFCEILDQLKVDVWELLPRPAPILDHPDIKALASRQVRGENELAFIEAAIKGEAPYGHTKTKNSDDSRKTSEGKRR